MIQNNIQGSVEVGKKRLEQIKEEIEETVNTNLIEVKNAISTAGIFLQRKY